ncbi:peptidase inhibitor family I36 protein [Streptomyces graminilatus]|uniref:peptidase inhibitor family I36 protein n=1 Tax=Streptomyces graminilatus TaxID=1464070 RepID=UPI0006E16D2A|nr:peptidase inhibitor family I36 protein [Streptomyces graminilatus]
MSVKRLVTVAASAAAVAALFSPVSTATALDAGSHGTKTARLASADGFLHVFTQPNGRGHECKWEGNSNNWGSCRNLTSDIWNNGYFGGNDAVDLYTAPNAGGAHACISQGDRWSDTTTNQYHFTYGAGLEGFGASVNNNISSHRWVDYCSQG